MNYLPQAQATSDAQLMNHLATKLTQMQPSQVAQLTRESIQLGFPVKHPMDLMDSLLEVLRRKTENITPNLYELLTISFKSITYYFSG